MKTQTVSKKNNHLLALIVAIICWTYPGFCFASIPETFQCVSSYDNSLNLEHIAQLHSVFTSTQTVATSNYIPTNMRSSNSSTKVATDIISHSLKNNAQLRESLHEIEDMLKFDGEFYSTGSRVPASVTSAAQSTNTTNSQHRFKAKIRQLKAGVEYNGLFDAELSYQVDKQNLQLGVQKKIGASFTVALNVSQAAATGTQETVQINWSW